VKTKQTNIWLILLLAIVNLALSNECLLFTSIIIINLGLDYELILPVIDNSLISYIYYIDIIILAPILEELTFICKIWENYLFNYITYEF
jgi:hypothetical protein